MSPICKVKYNGKGHVVGERDETGWLMAILPDHEITAVILPIEANTMSFRTMPLGAIEFDSWE